MKAMQKHISELGKTKHISEVFPPISYKELERCQNCGVSEAEEELENYDGELLCEACREEIEQEEELPSSSNHTVGGC